MVRFPFLPRVVSTADKCLVVSDLVVAVPASPPARLTTVARMTILDEIAQEMKEEDMCQRLGEQSHAAMDVEEPAGRQDLASPCVILPSATLSTFSMARHQKTGSIGESVFLGAGAIKKRKLDELTQANKENMAPNGAGPSKVARPRKSAKTPASTAIAPTQTMARPQSPGAIHNGKKSSKAISKNSLVTNGLAYPGALGMSEIISPAEHSITNRPWSTTGARTLANGGPPWIADTPTNQRQQRMQQLQSERPMHSMSRDPTMSAPQAIPSIFGGHPMQPEFVGMNSHLHGGMMHPPPGVSGGMELYVTDANGQPRLLPPNMIPVHSGVRQAFPMQHDPSQMPGVQYTPYGVHHGMPAFSATPQQGTFMMHEPHLPFMRTNSTNSVGSVESRHNRRQSIASQSQHATHQQGVPMTHQAYAYPGMQYPQLPYQYIHTEPSAPNGTATQDASHSYIPEAKGMMPYASGMVLMNDENIPETMHSRGSSKISTGMRRSGTESSSATGSRPATSHTGPLDMTMSMPLSTSANANLTTAAGFQAGLTGLDDVNGEEARSAGGTSSQASHRGKGNEMTLVGADRNGGGMTGGIMEHAIHANAMTTHRDDDHLGDDHGTPTAPIVLEPSNHAREMTEMETVEREFVKFSDGSDRDAFWTNDAL